MILARSPGRRWPLPWVGPGLLLLVEFLIFDQLGAHHQTWVYPRWNDQIQYLTESYFGFEQSKISGLPHALWIALTNPSAQGTLHDFWAILLFSVVGPSRSAALSLNMLAFLGWQLAVFAVVRRQTRSGSLAFVAAALLLCFKSGWAEMPGSAFDFRLDWFAACTMGIALAAAENTRRFERTGASALFGAATALVLLTRFLTGTYFLLIYVAFAVWVLLARERRGRRLANLVLASLIAAALAGPVFWINREVVRTYYFIGHFTGPESALRSPHMGLQRSTDWLLSHLGSMHIGGLYGWLVAALVLTGLVAVLLWPSRPAEKDFEFNGRWTSIVPCAAFFLAPALILILHIQKSEYVLAVLLPGVAGLCWLLLVRLLKPSSQQARVAIAAATVAVSVGAFLVKMGRDPHSAEFTASARHVATLADYIARRSAEAGLSNPRVAVDRVTDSLDAQVLRVICYERQHRWIPLVMTLPTGIGEEDPKLYWERLENSDFVFLTEEGNAGGWPYDHQLAAMRAQTLPWAESHLKKVESFTLPGLRMALFERKDLGAPAAAK